MRYMRQLDGLRCFAVLFVMFEHFAGRGANRLVPIGAGKIGVSLFFVLSGFLITGVLLRGFDRHGSRGTAWWEFYRHRILRLMPAYYAVLAVLMAAHVGVFATTWPWHAAYLTNLHVALGGDKPVFWSLAVEEQFYLLWPFLVAFAPRRRLIACCVVLIALGTLWRLTGVMTGIPSRWVAMMLPGSFEMLGVGCLLAALSYRDGEPNRFEWLTPPRRRSFAVAAGVCGVLSVALWKIGVTPNTPRLLLAVAFGWIVIGAASGFGGMVGRVLEHRVTVYVGRISYGIYLVHNFMPALVAKAIGPLPKHQAALIVIPATFAVCALSYRYMERPLRVWGHRRTPPASVQPGPVAATA